MRTLEEIKNKTRIIVTEIPYMVNKAQLIKDIAELVKDKKITEISDLRDESNREGMRIVIELKTGTNSDILLNKLYKHTRLQDTFGINLLALVDNQPKVLTLRDLIDNYILHRRTIVRKRTQYDLKQAVLISNDYHLPRMKAMMRTDKDLNKLFSQRKIRFRSAEKILIKYQPEVWQKVIKKAYQTQAMKQRIALEKKGVRDIKKGIYKFK